MSDLHLHTSHHHDRKKCGLVSMPREPPALVFELNGIVLFDIVSLIRWCEHNI